MAAIGGFKESAKDPESAWSVTRVFLDPQQVLGQSLAGWVRENRSALVRCARSICGDLDEAEDLVQEALIIVHRRWRRLRSGRPLNPYLRTVMINLHISEHRHARWRREVYGLDLVELVEAVVPAAAGPCDTPDEVLRDALGLLGPRQRAVVWLRYGEGRSILDTATVPGCQPGTVASQANRAIARLRSELIDGRLRT